MSTTDGAIENLATRLVVNLDALTEHAHQTRHMLEDIADSIHMGSHLLEWRMLRDADTGTLSHRQTARLMDLEDILWSDDALPGEDES